MPEKFIIFFTEMKQEWGKRRKE